MSMPFVTEDTLKPSEGIEGFPSIPSEEHDRTDDVSVGDKAQYLVTVTALLFLEMQFQSLPSCWNSRFSIYVDA